ncbi:MAG: isopentenyl-diphosphate Delta-isomerase [Arthrobacter sp.]|nr:isopentenyl-diphosphate Delta-isomerase [Micrococcaceae bacterium]MDN5813248.1 isopentenyl-diphosphate Delta-isomerase [Micrococcaceae bacterium]MDN5824005.1 isopentenyl-diphosphate Delta-isomerase [Micrococcaceae bacterium]MDN5880263.1 isopentenyl-diphosphate Delta-isomerase [Micrococcaceae bacterium]MDN5887689.1 isopentenyl-diphosphate Delta-isomerase [Micrococcaceae bacterium]
MRTRTPPPGPAENVVLLDADHQEIGSADKAEVHTGTTPLHLAFSCHVFDAEGRVLVTRRSLAKKAWPGVWTNSVCGHPAPGEPREDAVHRRAGFELGMELGAVEMVLPEFAYRAEDASGVVENEFCPVYFARAASGVDPRPSEVAEHHWVAPQDLVAAVRATPWAFSPWLVLQLEQLDSREIPYRGPGPEPTR